jgi:hypothetical protein
MNWRFAVICGTPLALIGAAAALAIGVQPSSHPDSPDPGSSVLPADMVPLFVEHCSPPDEGGAYLRQYVQRSWSIDDDAVVHVQLSYLDGAGRLVVDEAASATADDCLSERRVVDDDVDRYPNPAQLLVIRDWFWTSEAPCLSAHGMPLNSPDVEQMLHPRMILWYLRPIGGDFESELAARLACAPLPPYLENAGVGF